MVQRGDDILKLLMKEGAEAAKMTQRGLILQPGAVGDCLLTLPLVSYGGSSLVVSMVAIGLLNNIGRHRPFSVAAKAFETKPR